RPFPLAVTPLCGAPHGSPAREYTRCTRASRRPAPPGAHTADHTARPHRSPTLHAAAGRLRHARVPQPPLAPVACHEREPGRVWGSLVVDATRCGLLQHVACASSAARGRVNGGGTDARHGTQANEGAYGTLLLAR